ncbi:MAG: OmpW family outer membrane protein [Lysobacteraceae bacterium]|nr:OmpW family outer membrane protein [Xanthomonadaceae bacterium]HRX99164.1 OmpW family outer membrane protein [Xanthomonadaceae bacterium]
MKVRHLLAAAVLGAFAVGAQAQEAGDWVVKFGIHTVNPDGNNGEVAGGAFAVDVGNDTKPSLQAEYFFSPNLGVEVLAAVPFKHDIMLNGAKAATTKQLPPTVSVQWHFNPEGKVNPFVGAGINYTTFFSVNETGPLTGTQLNLDSSWGLAFHAGLDFKINDNWLFTVDGRWIDIDTDVKLDGAGIGTVNIDPVAYGVSIGYRF